jgi:hypothetical protein
MARTSAVEQSVRFARGRLFRQRLVNSLTIGISFALAVSLAWFVAQPLLLQSPADWLRWAVLGGTAALAVALAVAWTIRKTPSAETVALEIDARFGLKERVTTVVALPAELRATSAGQAILADAEAQVGELKIGERFPVRPSHKAWFVPGLSAAILAVVLWWNPEAFGLTEESGNGPGKSGELGQIAEGQKPKKTAPTVRPRTPEELARQDKSPELKELEAKLREFQNKYKPDEDKYANSPERQREKLTDVAKLEEETKKFVEDKANKLEQMQDKFNELEKLSKDKDFEDGPAKPIADALAKNDLKKAQEEVDELKKKLKDKDKKPTKEQTEKLEKQLDKMKDELQRLARDDERKKELEKKIDQAKKAGQDAESLERELEKVKEDAKQSGEQMEKIAKQFEKAAEALQEDDLEKAAEELAQAGKDLEDIQGEMQDLKDAAEQLQRLKQERRATSQAAAQPGDGQGGEKGDGQGGEKGDKLSTSKSGPNNGGIGAGEREINKDAKTNSLDERIRGLFDPKGGKSFNGLTRGKAFTKQSQTQLGEVIQQAVQDAPGAASSQQVPRDAQGDVREYYEKLGGSAPKK